MALRGLTLKDVKLVILFLGTILYSLVATMHVTSPAVDNRYCDVGVSFHLEDVTKFTCTSMWKRKVK